MRGSPRAQLRSSEPLPVTPGVRRLGWCLLGLASAALLVGGGGVTLGLRAMGKFRNLQCRGNLDQIALLTLMYSGDHDSRLPPACTWCDSVVIPYGDSTFWLRCPQAPKARCGYAFNASLNMRDRGKLDRLETVPLEFDGIGGWSAAGGPELFAPRHRGYGFIAFADGHVKRHEPKDLSGLAWNP
jgi:prepilin-type processing-associated H-X9-DG protein